MSESPLSRRERQIMDALYRRGRASAADIIEELPDAPSDSTVRTLLRILEEKGHVRHTREKQRFIYRPTRSRRRAARLALKRVLDTFFDGSVDDAVLGLLEASDTELAEDDLKRLSRIIDPEGKGG